MTIMHLRILPAALSIDVMKNDYGRDIIELLEAVAYLICQDDPITSNTFHAIMTSKSVSRKMMRLADTNRDEAVSVEELMNFIVYITKVPGFNNINSALLLANVTCRSHLSYLCGIRNFS